MCPNSLTTSHFNLSTIKEYKPNDAQIGLMESVFADSDPSGSDRMRLCFALAKVSEDLGEYDNSFNYLEEGNQKWTPDLGHTVK